MISKTLVLIQAPFFQDYGPMKKAAGCYFPMGLGYLGACARAEGYDVRFHDPNVQDVTPEEIGRDVRDRGALAIGISFMTPQFVVVKDMCDRLKRICPAVPIVLGGAHPSVMPERTLREIPSADFVVFGEGERTLRELLEGLAASRGGFSDVRGLAWRDGEGVRVNPPRPPIEDLDALPLPDRTLIDQSLYRAQSFLSHSSRTGAIYTSRGCPGRCVFCGSGHRLRAPVRERSVANVIAEIDGLVERYGMDYLLIKDDTFTIRRARTREFCDAIEGRHPGLKWHCMARVNTVDRDLLARMKRAGLHDVFLGIESGNAEILRRSRKGIKLEQVRSAVRACAELGISTYGAFILGLPGETPETVAETIDFACSLPLTMAGFSILTPYPGTRVFEEHYQADPDAPIDYHRFIASTGIHYVEGYTGLAGGLTMEQLPALVSRAQRRFYLRPRQMVRLLRRASPAMLLGYARGFGALVAKGRYLRKRAGVQGS